MLRVICINNSGKPNDVKSSLWLKLKTPYTVIEVANMVVQGIIGYKLEEIDSEPPYLYFDSRRFRELTPEEELELVEDDVLINS